MAPDACTMNRVPTESATSEGIGRNAGLPALVVLGPPGHGVAAYAADLAAAVRVREPSIPVISVPDLSALMASALPPRLHLHVTDRLFGISPEAAAEGLERLATRSAVTLTLHDLPQPSDGPAGLVRRALGYRRIARCARGVLVSSEHEAGLVREFLDADADPRVIPLGSRRAQSPDDQPAPAAARAVLIAGYVYPGKGHAEAIAAAAGARDAIGADSAAVTCIGAPSLGHEADLETLRETGARLGVDVTSTGYLDAEAYAARLRGAGTPVIAHAHVSSSRSLLDWLESGRSPLTLRSRYTEEIDRLRPGTLRLYESGSLTEAVAASWRDARSTWLTPGTALGPTLDDAARASLAWWSAVDW